MKKHYILLTGAILAATVQTQAQTKIGGAGAPDPSAMLEVTGGTGNNKGILPPRLTTTQRDAITLPATGLMIYNTTTNQLQVNTGTPAAPIWTISATTDWGVVGNTGTNPATNFIGTTDNQPLAVRTNSLERMRVNEVGNIGIGTITPAYQVHVVGTNGISTTVENTGSANLDFAAFRAIMDNNGTPIQTSMFATVLNGNPNGGVGGIQTNTANDLVFRTGQTVGPSIERMRIDTLGRIGIGTAIPRSLLSITPNADGAKITLWDGGNDTAHYGFGITGTFLNYHVVNSTAAHRFFAGGKNGNGTELVRIQGNGNVGIGNTAPAYKVHVSGTNGVSSTVENTGSANLDFAAFRAIMDNNGAPIHTSVFSTVLNGNANGGVGGIQTNTANDLVFRTGQTFGASIERMRIDTLGRIGIATAAPQQTLDIAGTARITGSAGTPTTILGRDASGNVGNMTLGSNLSITGGILNANIPTTGWALNGNAGTNFATDYIGTSDAQPLVVRTNAVEHMRITTDGNVGINNSAPQSRLSFASVTEPKISFYDGGANDYLGIGVSPSQLNYHVTPGANHVFFAGGKNGDGTELMRIQANGNIGIGTASPTAMLSVNGAANNLSGTWGIFSDARVKTVDGDYKDGLNTIMKIHPVKFHYNADAPFKSNEQQIGIIAQEVEQVAPYMITKVKAEGFDDLRQYNNQALPYMLVNAIQEQQKQIEALQAENKELKAEKVTTAQLMERVKQMEQMIGIKEIEGTSKVAGK